MTPPATQNQAMHRVDFDPFETGELSLLIPLTEPQKEIWTYAMMGQGANCSFNESVSLVLRGGLDLEALREAFQQVVDRHEALRITIDPEGDWLCVGAELALDIPLIDLSGTDDEAREKELAGLVTEEVETPFELVTGPLIRVRIVRLEEELHQILLTAHHVVCDGWSIDILVADLAEIYSALVQGRAPDLPEPNRFSDYALSLAEPETRKAIREDERYWLKQYTVKPPVVDMPTDRPRPALQTFDADRLDWELPKDLAEQLKTLGRKTGCTFLSVLLGGFAGFVHRLTGQDDIIIGLPAAGQSIAGQDQLVGHCVNILPLRFRLDPKMKFRDYLVQVRTTLLDAHGHQRASFGKLIPQMDIRRDPSRIPLAPVLFNLDQGIDLSGMGFAGLESDFFSNFRSYDNFEFGINISPLEGRFVFECTYNSNLWERETIVRRIEELGVFLASLAQDPDQLIVEAELLPQEEKERILALGQGPELELPDDLTVIDRFEEQARRNPGRLALKHADNTLTYGELNGLANRLAGDLMKKGFGPGDKVGLCVKRSPAIILGILGILKSGAAYVPIDPGLPAQRIAYLIDDCELSLILADSSTSEVLRSADRPEVEVDTTWSQSPDMVEENPQRRAGPDDLIYVMYTSGSTGQPKGVMISHQTLTAFLYDIEPIYQIGPEDRILQFVSYWWDPSVLDIFATLNSGAGLVLRDEEMIGSATRFFRFCQEHEISVFLLPTAYLNLMGHDLDKIEIPERLRLVSCVGEAMGPEPTAAWRKKLAPNARLINLYGPTECSMTCTYYEVESTEPEVPVPIGLPKANNRLYILDRFMNLCPLGVPGELHIGGPQVGLGYLNQPELTAEQFIPDPFGPNGKGLLYKSGDLFRFRNDGLLEIIGRVDHQVKIRGFRIELGEIQAAFVDYPDVRQAFLMVREDVPGNKNLTAYLVPAPGREVDIPALKAFLGEKLPAYMVPSDFVIMDRLPIASGGKIDRKALPSPRKAGGRKSTARPRSPQELLLAEIFAKVLKQPGVGLRDDFFDLGGNSLLAVRLVSRLEKELGQSIPVTTIFEAPTVEKLAAALDFQAPADDVDLLVKIKPGASQRPFFHIGQMDKHVRTFAGHLDIENPIYLLHVQPLDQKSPLFTEVNVIADHCLAEIRKIQPRGPYLLSGFCLGGFVAFEVARRLRAQGEEVPYLALIESYLPEAVQTRQDLGLLGLIKEKCRFYLSQRSQKGLLSALTWMVSKCLDSAWYYACATALAVTGALKLPLPRLFNHELVALAKARAGYDPVSYPGRAVIFRAGEVGPWQEVEPGLGWSRYMEEGVREVIVSGGHSSIYEEPNVKVFADKVKESIDFAVSS